MADGRSHAIRLDIKAGQLNFSASTPDDGEALESIPIDFNGEETSIGSTANTYSTLTTPRTPGSGHLVI